MKRTVVIICDQAVKEGGHARVAIESAVGLAESGEDVVYFASYGPIAPELVAAGVRVHLTGQPNVLDEANSLHGALRGIWNVHARKLISKLSGSRPGNVIFHVHGWTKSLSPSVLAEISSTRHPVVVTLHDFFTACPNGAFFNFPLNEVCEFRPMSRQCVSSNCDSRSYGHKIWRLLRQFVMERVAGFPSSVTDFIYMSEVSRSVISPYLPKEATYHYVPNPVFIEKTCQVRAWENSSFVYAGRLSGEKGVVQAALALHRLHLPMEIGGVGDVANEIRKINPDAVLHGWLNSAALEAMFNRARVLVFPSLWYETYGLVVYEALARGIPVIASRESAAAERIVDDRNGRLFSWRIPGEFEEALLSATDSSKVERWSRFAYADYWAAPSTIDLHVEALKAVYNEMTMRAAA